MFRGSSLGDECVIVIFGGAFNPPTKAHLEIYHHVKKFLKCDKLVFLPVSSLYTKRSLASNHHRYQMLTLLVAELDNVEVSTLEFDDSDYQGTYQSMLRFQEKYPTGELAFLIGADNLLKLHKWINARSLLSEFRFVVVNRNNNDLLQMIRKDEFLSEFETQFIILPKFDYDMSSTKFRETFDELLVTKTVYDYIKAHELYRG